MKNGTYIKLPHVNAKYNINMVNNSGRGSIWRLRTEAEREQKRALNESDHVMLGDYSDDADIDQQYEMMDVEGDEYSSE